MVLNGLASLSSDFLTQWWSLLCQVQVGDFGLARRQSSREKAEETQVIGTMGYVTLLRKFLEFIALSLPFIMW